MENVGLYVELEAKAGMEEALVSFLRSAVPLVQQEFAAAAWFAIQMGPSKFGIFDTFADEAGRQAHLSGRVAAALMEKAPELLAKPPRIEKVGILASLIKGREANRAA